MSTELKTHVFNFIDSLNIDKKGELYLAIKKHLEKHGKRK